MGLNNWEWGKDHGWNIDGKIETLGKREYIISHKRSPNKTKLPSLRSLMVTLV